MINAELASKTLAEIKADLDHHRQVTWAAETDCGTAYCFGARATVISGIPIKVDELGAYILPQDVPDGVEGITWTFRDDRITVKSVATSLLGLDEEQADRLFDPFNEVEDLEKIVNDLITEAYAGEINSFLGQDTELEEGSVDSVGEESQEVAPDGEVVPF